MVCSVTMHVFLLLILHSIFKKWTYFLCPILRSRFENCKKMQKSDFRPLCSVFHFSLFYFVIVNFLYFFVKYLGKK